MVLRVPRFLSPGRERGVHNLHPMERSRRKKEQEVSMQPATVAVVYGKLSDPELAQRIASGDKDAFELLMRRHNQILYRTARSILKDDAEAEDTVQEAWLLAYRGMSGFRGDAKLSTWLVRIVVNEAIGRARKRSRRGEIIQLSGETHEDSEVVERNMNETLPEQPEGAAQRAQ